MVQMLFMLLVTHGDIVSPVISIAEPRVLIRPGVTSEIILTNDKKVKIVEVATQGGFRFKEVNLLLNLR